MVRGIILEAEPFSVENNLLTPTLKLKRPQLQVTVYVSLLLLFSGSILTLTPYRAEASAAAGEVQEIRLPDQLNKWRSC